MMPRMEMTSGEQHQGETSHVSFNCQGVDRQHQHCSNEGTLSKPPFDSFYVNLCWLPDYLEKLLRQFSFITYHQVHLNLLNELNIKFRGSFLAGRMAKFRTKWQKFNRIMCRSFSQNGLPLVGSVYILYSFGFIFITLRNHISLKTF